MNSKGWQMLQKHLSNIYLEAETIVTADGTQVSNSVRLENANKMAIVKKVIHYPGQILQALQG